MRWFGIRSQSRGQGMVEFALVVPIFLALTFGVIELSWLMYHNHTLSSATREGARYAMVNGARSDNTADATSVQQVVRDNSGWISGQIDVDYLEWNPSATADAYEQGSTVTVRTSYGYQPIVGMIIGSGTITLTSESTVIVQY